ncbi:MAG: helix-turn-helix domain-containing protein [Pararhodobacter sp.]|nr:helix-turn-helix domain-containing protein [Pararhodobacter sp.]
MTITLSLLTSNEVTTILRVSTKTLRRMRLRGLVYVMLTSGTIRYRLDDLKTFIF